LSPIEILKQACPEEILKQACPEEILKQVQNDTFRVQNDISSVSGILQEARV